MANHVIIAGHGSGDPGAVGNGTTENKEMVRITDYMKELVKKHKLPVTIVNDHNVYKARDIHKYDDAASITELHMNAGVPSASGTEVLILGGYPPDARDKRILEVLKRNWINRGFKPRNDLYNMNTTKANYRLVEFCFITNKSDMVQWEKQYKLVAVELLEAILDKDLPGKDTLKLAKPKTKPSKAKYVVQTGAFSDKSNAEKHLKEVRKHFPKAIIKEEK